MEGARYNAAMPGSAPRLDTMQSGASSADLADEAGPPDARANVAAVCGRGIDKKKESANELFGGTGLKVIEGQVFTLGEAHSKLLVEVVDLQF